MAMFLDYKLTEIVKITIFTRAILTLSQLS